MNLLVPNYDKPCAAKIGPVEAGIFYMSESKETVKGTLVMIKGSGYIVACY